MAYAHIKGTSIKPMGLRPANFHKPTQFVHGSPKSVGNVKGGPNLGGTGKETFMKSQPRGGVSIKGSVHA